MDMGRYSNRDHLCSDDPDLDSRHSERMVVMKLSLADEQILKYLRKQVDRLQDERYRTDARPSINNEIFAAQQELRRFTSELRKKGYNI
jgi:hypothetical protein